MWHWRKITRGIRDWVRSDETDRELAEEIDHFITEAAADLVRRGVPPDEARRRVRLTYGDPLSAREDVRAAGWESIPRDLISDLRLAARRLGRTPGFTAIVTLVLGVGIGAATAIVSVVRPVLFDPLEYPFPERLVALSDRTESGGPLPVTFGTFVELSERLAAFESLSVYRRWRPTLTGRTEPERLDAQRVTASYFDVLGVSPAFGPGFDAVEDRAGGRRQILLSHALWTSRFDGDRDVVGTSVRLDRETFTVVGVMPEAFENATRPTARAWTLLQYGSTASWDGREWGHHLGMIGRLRGDFDLSEARAEAGEVAGRPTPEFARPPWAALEQGLTLTPLRDAMMRDARPASLVLLGAVALLLAIACVDLAILLVARGLRRQDELSVRAALGAGRARLMRQLTTESLLVAAFGGALALGVAQVAIDALVAVAPPALLTGADVDLDRGAVVFSLVVTGAVGLLAGLLPAWTASTDATARTGRGHGGRGWSVTGALITSEVALAFVLLMGSGLLVRTMSRLNAVPLGFEPGTSAVMQVHANGLDGGDNAVHAFWDAAVQAVREVPGVRAAATTSQLPLSGDVDVYGVAVHETGRADGVDGAAYRYAVTPEYMETMGIEVYEGRGLTDQDRGGSSRAVVVSRSLAQNLFPEGSAVGRELRIGSGGAPYTIVGVVEDVQQESLAGESSDAVYTTPHQWHWADRVRWITADLADPSAIEALKAAVWSVNRDQPVVRLQTMDRVVARSESQRRFVMSVMTACALFALVLSTLGLYGVLASGVAERTREMGVRSALGATQTAIAGLVIRQGMALAVVGIVLGLVLAVASSRLLSNLLFGITGLDPATYAGVSLLFVSVCALACSVPAIRASRMDPIQTLRSE